MTKEYLEAFESIMKIYGNTNSLEGTYNYFLIIKQALQRLESIDNANPSEALECLEFLFHQAVDFEHEKMYRQMATDRYTTIKQALLKAQEQELNNGGRLPNKEVLYLKQSLEQCNDKPIFYVSRTYGNKYIVQQKFLDDLTKENARNEEILQKYYQEGITLDSVRALKKEMAELKGQAQEPKQYLKWEDLEFEEDNETKIKVRMGEHIYDLWYGSYKTGYGTFKQKCSLAGYDFDEDYDIDIFNDLHLERVEE